MSDILIKGMKIPTYDGVYPCRLIIENGVAKLAIDYIITAFRDERKVYPLVPVPPHGRVIEESKVLDIVSAWCPDDDGSVGKDGDLREMLDEIEALPTIIPAEEGIK